jgi:DNA-binding NarL/FixJ family response regulator
MHVLDMCPGSRGVLHTGDQSRPLTVGVVSSDDFERARSLPLGRAQRRHRKWAASRRSLAEATAASEELGSSGWADGAGSELARAGARRPRAVGARTPAEARVVELAAEGRSNKEIARILFVSVKTVGLHLSHAYATLGIRSRSQLASRLSPPSKLR